MQVVTRFLVLLLVSFLLTSCGGGGKSASIPDMELRSKWKGCKAAENPSRIKAMACENYERECARRKKNGKRVCM